MVYITVISSDGEHQAEIAALNATTLALRVSSVPFPTMTAAVRVGRIEGKMILNPTITQLKDSELDLIVAGTRAAINMVEAGARARMARCHCASAAGHPAAFACWTAVSA